MANLRLASSILEHRVGGELFRRLDALTNCQLRRRSLARIRLQIVESRIALRLFICVGRFDSDEARA